MIFDFFAAIAFPLILLDWLVAASLDDGRSRPTVVRTIDVLRRSFPERGSPVLEKQQV
jgi:hypothetical protein